MYPSSILRITSDFPSSLLYQHPSSMPPKSYEINIKHGANQGARRSNQIPLPLLSSGTLIKSHNFFPFLTQIKSIQFNSTQSDPKGALRIWDATIVISRSFFLSSFSAPSWPSVSIGYRYKALAFSSRRPLHVRAATTPCKSSSTAVPCAPPAEISVLDSWITSIDR
jgi:hypothetical protein